jgi:cell division protein FtsN
MAKPASRDSDRASKSPRKGGSVFTGVLIGLTVGAILAVGVALLVTGNNPFKLETAEPEVAEPAAPAVPDAAPSFDFYKVLPGDAPTELPPAAAPADTPAYYLQAGAFQNANDADNMKAQLALLGLEATIQTSDQGEQGVFHRVRVGPFGAMDAVENARSLLTQNNIPVVLVKETSPTQETP